MFHAIFGHPNKLHRTQATPFALPCLHNIQYIFLAQIRNPKPCLEFLVLGVRSLDQSFLPLAWWSALAAFGFQLFNFWRTPVDKTILFLLESTFEGNSIFEGIPLY